MQNPQMKNDGSWHLDKRINVGHLLTTVVLAVSLFSWASVLEKRLAVLEEKALQQRINDDRQDVVVHQLSVTIRDELRDMNKKLDRLVEFGRK